MTPAMLEKAEQDHFRTETYSSLVKAHALAYLYYKQKGNLRVANRYLTSSAVRKKVRQLETARPIRRKRVGIKPSMFKPTTNWGFN